MTIKIKVERELDNEFIGDVLVTAFDGAYGACWYWATPASDHWLEGTRDSNTWESCHIRTDEDSQFGKPIMDQPHYVTADVLRVGIQRLLDGDTPFADDLRDHLVRAVLEADAGEIDASLADCIVQAGIFGEIVFG